MATLKLEIHPVLFVRNIKTSKLWNSIVRVPKKLHITVTKSLIGLGKKYFKNYIFLTSNIQNLCGTYRFLQLQLYDLSVPLEPCVLLKLVDAAMHFIYGHAVEAFTSSNSKYKLYTGLYRARLKGVSQVA